MNYKYQFDPMAKRLTVIRGLKEGLKSESNLGG